MELNALNETCTQQKVDYEMELSEISLTLNSRLAELNEKLSSTEAKMNEYEQELAVKSARLDEMAANEAALREEIEGKESTINILKNSLMVKNAAAAAATASPKGYFITIYLYFYSIGNSFLY